MYPIHHKALYDVTLIDVETVGSIGAVSKQGFQAYYHVLDSSEVTIP